MAFFKDFEHQNIIAIDIFLERKKNRLYVGRLEQKKEKSQILFVLEYDKKYLYEKKTIPLGPELPLTKMKYTSPTLFETFVDRIPSKENPAYPDYCRSTGISVSETNPIILLATIGRRGPSSFIFEPVYKNDFSVKDLIQYRKKLGLTLREFALAFNLAYSNLHKIETGSVTGEETLKRIEIYIKFPNVALYEFLKNSNKLHSDKQMSVIEYLSSNIKS